MSRRTRELSKQRNEVRQKTATRRRFVFGGLGLLAAGGAAWGFNALLSAPPSPARRTAIDPARIYPSDVVTGNEDAPVTVIEYASLTCVHCARFHEESHDAFVEGWVETGKARLVYRHFPLDATALRGAEFVSCLPERMRAAAVSQLFRHREAWTRETDVAAAALRFISLDPRTRGEALACAGDGSAQSSIMEAANEGRREGIESTPTFVVNGAAYRGFMSAEALGAIVESHS